MGNKLSGQFVLACVLVCCSISGFAQELIFPDGKAVFPELLDDLTWQYDESVLRKRLPNSEVQDTKYGEGEMDSIYTKVSLPYFGESMLDVDHDNKGVIRFIYITATETRKQCALENVHRPSMCRNKRGKILTGIRNNLVSYIQSKHGKGVATLRCEVEQNIKICENVYSWTTKNAKLNLGIYPQGDGGWNVSLHIMNTKQN